MSFEIIVSLVAFFGLIFLVAGSLIFFRKSIFKTWCIGTSGALLILLSVGTLISAFNLFQFQPVQKAKAALQLEFIRMAPQVYRVKLSDFDGKERSFVIKGDLWRVDAHLLLWGDLFKGLKARDGYRFHQVVGRYLTLEQERDFEREPFVIKPESQGPDLWQIDHDTSMVPMFSTEVKKSVFVPMAHQGIFTLGFFPDEGLSVRPVNDEAQAAFDLLN